MTRNPPKEDVGQYAQADRTENSGSVLEGGHDDAIELIRVRAREEGGRRWHI
jgi:hypothetical protein